MSSRRRQMGMQGGDAPWASPTIVAPPEVRIEPPSATATRSPLTDTFPTFRTIRGGFGLLPSPNAGFTAPANTMAMYPLVNMKASEFLAQDILLTAVHCVLGSAGVTPSWGNSSGDGGGAGIIVGVNIPNLLKTGLGKAGWSFGRLPMSWVDPGVDAVTANDTRYVFASPFAPGVQGTNPSRVDPSEDFPPHVIRLKKSDRIQAAFVLNRAQANAAAGALAPSLRGLCEIRIRLGLTFTNQGLAQP